MIQTIKKSALWLACMAAFLLTSCDKTAHEIPEQLPEKGSAITVGINTDAIPDTPLRDVHLYFFDASEMLAKHVYYPTMQSLALDRMMMETGYYTIFAILNTKESLVPGSRAADVPQISFADFCQWVKELDETGDYTDLATGLVRYEVKEGVTLVTIDVKKGSEAVGFSNVILNLNFPSPTLPDFQSLKKNRAAGELQLRAVVEAYQKDTRTLRKEVFVTPTSEGVYTCELQLIPGDYDLRIWADYTDDKSKDNHYVTTNLESVKILSTDQYRANTDTRDAFTQVQAITVGNKDQSTDITMHRPLAKYRLVATDVKKYNDLRVSRGYPAMEDLQISIAYEGFFPCAYNVKTQKPSDSVGGYGYASALSEQGEDDVTVGKDFILVNGDQSFVTVTILFKDADGKTISGIKGVKIDYRAGQLTTVSGEFLTAGIGGGVQIDTEWSGDYDVEF